MINNSYNYKNTAWFVKSDLNSVKMVKYSYKVFRRRKLLTYFNTFQYTS